MSTKLSVFFCLLRLVSTYLVHHGYSATAEVFAQTTGQPISEDLSSIKNRQSINKYLVKLCTQES